MTKNSSSQMHHTRCVWLQANTHNTHTNQRQNVATAPALVLACTHVTNRIGGGWVTENTMWLKLLAFWLVKITDLWLDVDGFSTFWSNQIGCWSFSLLWSNQIVSIILVVLFFHPGVSTLVISVGFANFWLDRRGLIVCGSNQIFCTILGVLLF